MYSRICIFGRPGSGKSTFALKLHKKTGLPLYHLDKFFFVENWVERNYQEFLNIQQELVNKENWIIDGNALQSLEMRYSRAQICLYFNYSKLFCLYRIFKRLFDKDPVIKDRAEGCREGVRWRLIKYMWTFQDLVDDKISNLHAKYPNVKFIEINNDKDLEKIYKLFNI